MKFQLLTCWCVLSCFSNIALAKDAAQETVSKHGQLSVSGTHLVDKNGEKFQLKGFSLFWDVWKPQYYNEETIAHIHEQCHANVVRAPMAVQTDDGGYLVDPKATLERLRRVVDAAIKNNIYVIVDWHEDHAENHLAKAKEFFDTVSKEYGKHPNIIYEIFNEPLDVSWANVLKPYHEAVIKTIRANDPNNIIVVGTPNWSRQVEIAAKDPITGQKNIMYTLHFYAGLHNQYLRDTVQGAIDSGLPVFVTEYGTVNADGDGPVAVEESHRFWEWLDKNSLSYANWAISDKPEGASALVEKTTASQVCLDKYLTESGRLVVEQNKK